MEVKKWSFFRDIIKERLTSSPRPTHTEQLSQMALALRAGLWRPHVLMWRGVGRGGGKNAVCLSNLLPETERKRHRVRVWPGK